MEFVVYLRECEQPVTVRGVAKRDGDALVVTSPNGGVTTFAWHAVLYFTARKR